MYIMFIGCCTIIITKPKNLFCDSSQAHSVVQSQLDSGLPAVNLITCNH